jgi:hypothetical protein
MARRLYLHIGTMKSATTYLQHVLDANREQLEDAGLLWLPSGKNHQAINDFLGTRRRSADSVGAWDNLCTTVREYPGDVLFSTELMGPIRRQRVEKLMSELAPQEARVIITARDLTKVVPSHWQETTQNQGTMSWREWVDRVSKGPEERGPDFRFWTHHDLAGLIDNWQVAAPGQVYLVTVPASQSDPELIWRRFAAAVELDLPSITPPRSVNPALGAVSAELMRRINIEVADVPFPSYGPGFKQLLAKRILVKRAAAEPRPGLDADDYARLRQIALEIVEQVRQRDVTVIGDLADLIPAESAPSDGFDPAAIDDSQLLQVAIEALAGVGLRLGEQQTELKRLRSRQVGADEQQVVSAPRQTRVKDASRKVWSAGARTLASGRLRARALVTRLRR